MKKIENIYLRGVLFVIGKLCLGAWIVAAAIKRGVWAVAKTLYILVYKKTLQEDLDAISKGEFWVLLWLLVIILYALIGCGLNAKAMTLSPKAPVTYSKEAFQISHIFAIPMNEYQNYWMDVAWNKYKDIELMHMFASENGLFNHDRQSDVWLKWVNGKKRMCHKDLTGCFREDSWGFCQIYRPAHPEIVNDPRFFTDPEWQIDQCYRLFKGGTPFYGYERFKRGALPNASFDDKKFREERIALFSQK